MTNKMIPLDEFTLDELELLETISQMTFTEIAVEPNRPKVIKAILWISAKRANPDIKIDEIGKLSLQEATDIMSGVEDPKV